jgi:Superinfection immunity protein
MGGIIGLVILSVVYLFPTLVAACRSHHQTAAICALNHLLGWTVRGWIIALVWALTAT